MKKRGFTLIEILVVIGIIGLLAAIMIPAAGGAKDALTRTKSKSRFNEWVTAIEQYKMTYGFYPTLGQNVSSGTDAHFDLGQGSNSEAFVKTLSGKDPKTSEKLKGAERTKYNRKATEFISFDANDFEDADTENAQLVDGFGNKNIHVVMDTTGNGRVEIPQQYMPEDATDDEQNEKGMMGKVIIFTSEKDGDEYESIYSWR